jgi:hypothetical protein
MMDNIDVFLDLFFCFLVAYKYFMLVNKTERNKDNQISLDTNQIQTRERHLVSLMMCLRVPTRSAQSIYNMFRESLTASLRRLYRLLFKHTHKSTADLWNDIEKMTPGKKSLLAGLYLKYYTDSLQIHTHTHTLLAYPSTFSFSHIDDLWL